MAMDEKYASEMLNLLKVAIMMIQRKEASDVSHEELYR